MINHAQNCERIERLNLRIPILSRCQQRKARMRLRCVMHGYRFLKESNQLNLIVETKEEMTNRRISQVDKNASKWIFGAGVKNAELIVRQYLLMRRGGLDLNKAILCALGSAQPVVVYAMPSEWQEVLMAHKISVDKFRCTALWYAYVLRMVTYGLASMALSLLHSAKEIVRPSPGVPRAYAYFKDLVQHNLPVENKNGRGTDIVTWYLHWPGRHPDVNAVFHSVRDTAPSTVDDFACRYLQSEVIPLTNGIKLMRYGAWCVWAGVIALRDLLIGRWWHGLLLIEAVKAAQARIQNQNKLAKEYLFHNSSWIYRPLWTYEAENRGSRITFYFYSTNCETFKRPEGYPVQANSWQVMNWPLYLVWDEYQADFVRRVVSDDAHIAVVGSIDFTASAAEISNLPAKSFAVFDVQPMRESFYDALGIALEYYTPEVCNRFLMDIFDVLKCKDAAMAHKRKRKIGNLAHYKYRNLLRHMEENAGYISVDSRINAKRVVDHCIGVISMPFTSTALLGREAGKPSIYYDPLGLIQKDDRGAHGIPIIVGIDELRDWVSAVLSQCEAPADIESFRMKA
jgi:polysaccharide biosynthesis PFTS motif protein